MRNRLATTICAALAAAVLVPLAHARGSELAPTPAPLRADAWEEYWHGLMALREAQYAVAASRFEAATAALGAEPRMTLARGVALALDERFDEARAVLAATRLPRGDREAELWSYAVEAMSNFTTPAESTGAPRSLQKRDARPMFMGVPGHVVQGGRDYSTAYASCVIYELASHYRRLKERGEDTRAPRILEARAKAARWFANRKLATPELIARNLAYADRAAGEGRLLAARELLDVTLFASPADPAVRCASAELWLAAGRAATAREEFTIALTYDTRHAAAFAGRAEAAARLGDAVRARKDAASAAALGAGGGLAERVEATLRANAVDADPAKLLAALDEAALGGAAVPALAELAARLHSAAEPRRVRHAELHQERIAALEDAIRARPDDAAPRVALARYLCDESDARGEQVEPRRGKVAFRFQPSPEHDLRRALEAADGALRLAPDDCPAMVAKAFVLAALGDESGADRLVTAAIERGGASDPDAARLCAEFRNRQASRMLAQAAMLRTPMTSSSVSYENRYDGVYRVTTFTTHEPSASELAAADALEREARAMIARARALMELALRASPPSLERALLESSYEQWFGSPERALERARAAVREYPRALAAHDRLIELLRFSGRASEALAQEAVSWQLFETTAAPHLRAVWEEVGRRGWAPLAPLLAEARRVAPCDARGTAYLARAAAEIGDTAKARAYSSVAAALEAARMQRDDRGEARAWPRSASDVALALRMHQDLAGAAQDGGGLADRLVAAALADRFGPDGGAEPMFGAMLPSASAQPGPKPAPSNGATLATESYLGAAKALRAAGRAEEADRLLLAATRWTRPADDLTPNVGDGRGDSNFGATPGAASAEALVELAKADVAAQRYKEALARLQAATQYQPSRELRLEINELIKQIAPKLRR